MITNNTNDKVMGSQEMARRNSNTGLTIWDLFNRPLNSFGDYMPMMRQGAELKTDIKEEADKYELAVDVPGIKRDDIKLSFNNGVLTIEVCKQAQQETKDGSGFLLKERSFGSMSRSFAFDDVDENSIDASLQNGVLHLCMKKQPQAQKRTISIK